MYLVADEMTGPLGMALTALLDPIIALMGEAESLATYFREQCQRQDVPIATIRTLSTSGAFETIDFLNRALSDAAASDTETVSICMDKSGTTADRLECAFSLGPAALYSLA